MEIFAKVVGYQLSTVNYFTISFSYILVIWLGAEYASYYVTSNYTESEGHSQKSS